MLQGEGSAGDTSICLCEGERPQNFCRESKLNKNRPIVVDIHVNEMQNFCLCLVLSVRFSGSHTLLLKLIPSKVPLVACNSCLI